MADTKIEIKTLATNDEIQNRQGLLELMLNSPVVDNEKIANAGLFLKRQELSKILFLQHLYQKILDKQGAIIEFGVRWGQNLVTLTNLRGIYEPYSHGRKILGFDTFTGFLNTTEEDGDHEIIKEGAFAVTEGYEAYLEKLLILHQKESPLNHINKNFLFKGDAVVEFRNYISKHPELIVAMAYFDFDIYQPTKECLEMLLPLMPKGGIIVFDELTDAQFPGESIAFKEVMNLRSHTLYKNPFGGLQSYLILE